MVDNSPAIYRREDSQNCPSSEGTVEVFPLSSQPSLRDFMDNGEYPAINRRAIIECSYGTTRRQNAGQHPSGDYLCERRKHDYYLPA
jgi:hypothetical protein